MWRCEWIWQTYCWVMVTSIALGLVTTILWCSWWGCMFANPRTPPLTSATASMRVVTGRRMAKTMGFMALTAPGWFAAGRHPQLGRGISDGEVPCCRLRRKRANTRRMTRFHEHCRDAPRPGRSCGHRGVGRRRRAVPRGDSRADHGPDGNARASPPMIAPARRGRRWPGDGLSSGAVGPRARQRS